MRYLQEIIKYYSGFVNNNDGKWLLVICYW